MIERIDSAVFGPVPAFVRMSLRLTGIDPARAAASAGAARAYLARAAAGGAGTPDDDLQSAAWRAAYADVGLGDDVLSPVAALRAWAAAPGGVPSQGALLDLVNAISLLHGAPTAAYDLAGVAGDLWLRPSRGVESFEAPAAHTGRPSIVEINELILADSADHVVARSWHGSPGRQAIVGPGSRDVLVHVDRLAPPETPEATGEAIGRLIAGFVGARFEVRVLTRGQPSARWPA